MDNQEKKRRFMKITPAIKETLEKMLPKETQMNGSWSSVIESLVERGGINADKETKEFGIQFLVEAQRDSKTCLILYKKKVYSHAVYHLQQAVEKTVKAYVLIEGFYTAKEMREIAIHESPLIIIKALTEKTGMKKSAKLRDDKDTLATINNAEQTIINKENRVAVAKMSHTEVR